MNCSSMDVTIHCDDLVPIDINISDLTRAREVIHQVVSSRRLMTPSVNLEFDDCIISIDDGVRIRLLSRESIVLSALAPKDEQSSHLDLKITASGFRAKAVQSIQSAGQSNYLIEKKTLELRYLLLTSGSNIMSGVSSPLRLTTADANDMQDEHIPRSSSSNSSSYNSSSHSSNRLVASAPDSPYETSFSNFLLQKYLTFSTQIEQFLKVEKARLIRNSPILDLAEVFLNQRNLPQLFVMASQYDAENFSQSLSAAENEVISAVQSGGKADFERGLTSLPGPASSHEAVPQNTAVTHRFTTNSEYVKIHQAKSTVPVVPVAVPPVSATVAGGLAAVSEVLKSEQNSDDDSSSSSDSDSDSESEESSDEEEEEKEEKVANAVVSADVAVAGSVMLPVQSGVTATATLEGDSSGSDSNDDSSDEETDIPNADVVPSKPLNVTSVRKHMESEAITQDTKVRGIAMQSAALNSGIGTAVIIPAVKESIVVVAPKKIEIEAESSGSDSDDDSGDETESEVERKPLLASTPVLFESKKKTVKTVKGAVIEKVLSGSGSSSSSDSDSDSDSSDDEVEGNIDIGKSDGSAAISFPTAAVTVPVQEDAAMDTSNSPKITSKLIEVRMVPGGPDGKPTEVTIIRSNDVGLPGDDSSSNGDADDVWNATTAVNPIADMAAIDMPFTQDLQSYDIQQDSESACDESVGDGSVDDNDNSTEEAAKSTYIPSESNGSQSTKSIAHPEKKVDDKKSKLSSKEISVYAAPKVKNAASEDSDSGSSSSSGDDDSDDESSVDYQPAPKKPPLALMQLLFKKPTAKFPSCFLPAQKTKQSDPQKRKTLDNAKNEGSAKKSKKSSSQETDVQKISKAVSSSSSVTASEQGSTSAAVEVSKADSVVVISSQAPIDATSSAAGSQANTVTVPETVTNSPGLTVQRSSKVKSTPTAASEEEAGVNPVDSKSQSKVKRVSKTPSASRNASVPSSSSDNHVAVQLSSSSNDRDVTATNQSNSVANNTRPTGAKEDTPAVTATPKKTRAKAVGKSQVASATIEPKSNLKMTPANASKKRKIESDRIAGIAASPKTPQLEGVSMSKSISSKRK